MLLGFSKLSPWYLFYRIGLSARETPMFARPRFRVAVARFSQPRQASFYPYEFERVLARTHPKKYSDIFSRYIPLRISNPDELTIGSL